MNELVTNLGHLLHYDNFLHWCFLVGIGIFLAGLAWMFIRVLIPLRRLAQAAQAIADGTLTSFDMPRSGIREIEQLHNALQRMMSQLQSAQHLEIKYRQALTETQEHERLRIARDIHDDTIQALILVAHNIDRAARAPIPADYLAAARKQLVETINSLRTMIANLRPSALDELGLVTAIELLCEQHPHLAFQLEGDVYEMDSAQELAIFRAAQEAVRNAERHANAKTITVHLTYAPTRVVFEVSDDGVGFHIPTHLHEFAAHGHYGLLGVQERISHLGGQLCLRSEKAAGTRITVTFPRPAEYRMAYT